MRCGRQGWPITFVVYRNSISGSPSSVSYKEASSALWGSIARWEDDPVVNEPLVHLRPVDDTNYELHDPSDDAAERASVVDEVPG